jgi:rhodanese-related sulfurtransferase
MDRIGLEELRILREAGSVTLIEALSVAAYEAEHLPGALNAPDVLTADVAARLVPDRDATVVVYCSGPACGRSKVTAAALLRLGYTNVRVFSGGKLEWMDAGLPFEGTRAGMVA